MRPWILLTLGAMICLIIISVANIITTTQSIAKTGVVQNSVQNTAPQIAPGNIDANTQDAPAPHACGMGTGGGCGCGG